MSNAIQLPIQLQKLGLKRYEQLYPQHPIESEVVRLLALSDFAWRCIQSQPDLKSGLLCEDEIKSRDIPSPFENLTLADINEAQCHQILRKYREKYWLKVAFLDLCCENPIADSIEYISQLADKLIQSANEWAHAQVATLNGEPVDEQGQSLPLMVLGMGKLGGKELNYSSDIDLIFAYPRSVKTQGGRKSIEAQVFYTKVAQKLIAALNQTTGDGQVFRVDMRLRPFGESGPLVMSFNAIEDYYQEQGRDWERYAMLKSRLIGKPNHYWDEFNQLLKPFVYRRYIDFSVIESLRKMKLMIAQEVRRKRLTNNIKLGAGGIREVEFIVQALQMVRGGREANLQTQSLLNALKQLALNHVIDDDEAKELKSNYLYLRKVEQYLQIFDDQQTQTLPDNDLDQQRLLIILADLHCYDWPSFLSQLAFHMQGVHQQFVELIGEESPNRQAVDQYWTTLWDSQWSDEESIAWIENSPQLGHEADGEKIWQSDVIWQALRDFRREMIKCSMGNRGRQVLDKLIPTVLWHLANLKLTDQTLVRVLGVLTTVATRTAYLELLFENEGALKQLIHLCRNSSWVAEYIAKYPILLDELIDPKLFHQPPLLSSYVAELRETMLRVPDDDQEAQMIVLREFKQVKQLRIAAADITGILPITKVSDHLTALAEAIVEEVANLAWQQVSLRFGVPSSRLDSANKGFAIIGYGKLGGIELGYSSDLDLVYVHDANLEEMTTGPREISAGQFYLKLAQRMMHLFNTLSLIHI